MVPATFVHGLEDGLVAFGILSAADASTLMEGVHGIVARDAHDLSEPSVVVPCHFPEVVRRRVHDEGALEHAPSALVFAGNACTAAEVGGHHAAESRQHGLHAQFAFAADDAPCQVFLTFVPGIVLDAGGRLPFVAAPSLQVVHTPPGGVGRTGDEGFGIGLAVAVILHEECAPYALETYNLQRHVDAVEGHPVDFLLPSLPGPGGHGISEGAVVEIIPEFGIADVAFGCGRQGKSHTGKVGGRLVPRQVDVGMMVEIPSDAGGEGRDARPLYGRFAVVGGDDEDFVAGVPVAGK